MMLGAQLGRRSLLAAGVGTAALLLGIKAKPAQLNPYSFAQWQPHLGKSFSTDTGAVLRLVEATELRATAHKGEYFQLRFQVTKGVAENQTLELAHPLAGGVQLFLLGSATHVRATIDQRTPEEW